MKVYGIVTIATDVNLRKVEENSVVDFSVVYTETVGKGESRKRFSHFINVEAWAGAADFLHSKCKKGDKLFIEGILRQNRWEDNTGQKRSRNVVRIQNFQLMDDKNSDDPT